MADEPDFMSEDYARDQRAENRIDGENSLGRAWQEHVAGNPGISELSDKDYQETADRFFAASRKEMGHPAPTDEGAQALRELSKGPRDIATDMLTPSRTGAER